MKVLMISGVYYPKINGASVAVSNMIDSLASRGHHVTLITRREKGSPRFDTQNGVRIVRVGRPGFQLTSRVGLSLQQFRVALAEAKSDVPDVIHAHGFTSLLSGAALGILLSRPVVVNFHGIQRLWSGQARWRSPLTFQLMFPVEMVLLRRASAIIAQSNLLKKIIIQVYAVGEQKVVVVPNPVDVRRFECAPPSPQENPVVLFVGSLMKVHGPDILVEAAPYVLQRYPGAKLILVGKGPLKKILEKRISELGLGSSVLMLDEVRDSSRLADIYRASRLVVIPLRYTGYILSLVGEEGMASGRPFVTTMTLDEELSKFGVPRAGTDGSSLGTAILSVLDWDPERYDEVSRSARDYAVKKFSFEAVGENLENTYERALSIRAKGARREVRQFSSGK